MLVRALGFPEKQTGKSEVEKVRVNNRKLSSYIEYLKFTKCLNLKIETKKMYKNKWYIYFSIFRMKNTKGSLPNLLLITQPAFTCSNRIETPEQCVKSIES